MRLWGKDYTRRELEARVGDLRQVADIRLVTLDDGTERGVRAAQVRTGSGFDFIVLLDRAMDIGTATFKGIPLNWQSGTGDAHPSRYESGPRGWHLNFHGGLLTLCGLTNAGRADPSVDPETGETLVTHGRISNTPAYDIGVEREWSADDRELTLRLRGTVDDASLGGYRLRLQRTLEVRAGEAAVTINDEVRNLGGTPAPLMILYHCNFGWPLIGPETLLTIPSTAVIPYDAVSEATIERWREIDEPRAGRPQQAFFHDIAAADGPVTVRIGNPRLALEVGLSFDAAALPHLTQWKMMGFSDYVLGIEPGTCRPEGRVKAREAGRLTMIQPRDTHACGLQIAVTELANGRRS